MLGSAQASIAGRNGLPAVAHRVSLMRHHRGTVLAFALVFLLGVSCLHAPFGPDQALYSVFSEMMREGARLYADMWDIKQPGIFLFYAAAGTMFGPGEIGVHLLELGWMLALAALAFRFVQEWLGSCAALAPLFLVGGHYMFPGWFHLAQIESLVALPILAGIFCGLKARQSHTAPLLFLAGAALGVVLVLKIVYGAILVIIGMFLMYEAWRENDRRFLYRVPWSFAGTAFILAPVILWLVYEGALSIALWTWFEYPKEVMAYMPFRYRVLADSLLVILRNFSPLLALAVFGLWKPDSRTRIVAIWAVVGSATILMQYMSWWPHHFVLLLAPLGLLATRGVFHLASRLPAAPLAAAVLLMLGPMLAGGAVGVMRAARSFPASVQQAGSAELRSRASEAYRIAEEDLRFLPGPTHFIAEPVYYHLSGQRPATRFLLPLMQTTPETLDAALAQILHADLPYLFIQEGALDFHKELTRVPVHSIVPALEEHYAPLRRSPGGMWYRRR